MTGIILWIMPLVSFIAGLEMGCRDRRRGHDVGNAAAFLLFMLPLFVLGLALGWTVWA